MWRLSAECLRDLSRMRQLIAQTLRIRTYERRRLRLDAQEDGVPTPPGRQCVAAWPQDFRYPESTPAIVALARSRHLRGTRLGMRVQLNVHPQGRSLSAPLRPPEDPLARRRDLPWVAKRPLRRQPHCQRGSQPNESTTKERQHDEPDPKGADRCGARRHHIDRRRARSLTVRLGERADDFADHRSRYEWRRTNCCAEWHVPFERRRHARGRRKRSPRGAGERWPDADRPVRTPRPTGGTGSHRSHPRLGEYRSEASRPYRLAPPCPRLGRVFARRHAWETRRSRKHSVEDPLGNACGLRGYRQRRSCT